MIVLAVLIALGIGGYVLRKRGVQITIRLVSGAVALADAAFFLQNSVNRDASTGVVVTSTVMGAVAGAAFGVVICLILNAIRGRSHRRYLPW